MKESQVLQELHKIREEHYEATKHLSPAEYVKKLASETEKLKKLFLAKKQTH
jgi:hypothetical protein